MSEPLAHAEVADGGVPAGPVKGTARRWRGLGLLVGALLGVALLAPAADRDVLVAQGVGHVLEAELAAARGARGGEASLSEAVGALAATADVRVAEVRVRVDGRAVRSAPLERAIRAQWSRHRAARAPALPALRFGEGTAPDAARVLHLEIASRDGRVRVAGQVVRDGVQRPFAGAASWPLPGRAALLPPLLAILVGLAFGRTLLALFLGVYAGAVLLAWPEVGLAAPVRGLADVFTELLAAELQDSFRLEIVVFIAALIGMVGVMGRIGGLQGLADRFVGLTRSPRRAQLAAAGLGLALFFDDYANCVLVGSTMRPITDRLRIAREKLAWIVDSTAAPVASLSLLSTWIVFQVSLFAPQLPALGLGESGYAMFIATLPYRFYCGLTLLFVFSAIVSRRDFGPMARAEARARTTGALVRAGGRAPLGEAAHRVAPEPGVPHDWRLAAAPLGLTTLVTLVCLFAEGGGVARLARDPASLLTLPGLASLLPDGGAGPLVVGALAGLLLAFFLGAGNRARAALVAGLALGGLTGLWLPPTLPAWMQWAARAGGVAAGAGLAVLAATALRVPTRRPFVPVSRLLGAAASSAPTLGFALALLFLAWMIGAVCRELRTADYLVALLSGVLPAALLPLLLFLLSGLVAFATGSSWSTLSILLPNVVALAAAAGAQSPLGVAAMVALCLAAVLEGAVFGDHCSPISDTTVLSSVAAGSDHLDHVRTQAPYALAVAGVSAACGYLPLLLWPGWSAAAGFAAGTLVLWGGLWVFGRSAPAPDRPVAPPQLLQ